MKKLKKSFSIERGFISKLIETKNFNVIKEQQISRRYFTGENARVFQFLLEHFRETGQMATERVLFQKFPNFNVEYYFNEEGEEVVGTEENLIYWSNQLRLKAKHNKMASGLEEASSLLNENSTENAYTLLKRMILEIEENFVFKTSVDITKVSEDRITTYLEKKKNKGIIGIESGIPLLDHILKGFVEKTLTVVLGTTGVGKSWFLVLLASYMMLCGYRVCMFLTEMSEDLMQDRIEAMLFGMMYGDFDYGKFKSGNLDKATEEQYFEFLREDLPKLEPLILERVNGISSVVSAFEQHKPDIIMIDGVYLMEDERGAKDDWLRVTHITRDLKKFAKDSSTRVIVNTQADKSTSKKAGPELGNIMFAQSIGHDADNVLALFRDEVMALDGEMGLSVLKNREGTQGKVYMNWKFNTMNFKSIYSDVANTLNEETEEDTPRRRISTD